MFCFLQLKVFLLTVNHNNDDAAAVSDIVVVFVAGGRGANVVDVVFDVAVLFLLCFLITDAAVELNNKKLLRIVGDFVVFIFL